MPKLKIFIGSSSEGLTLARNLARQLNKSPLCEATAWTHVFSAGTMTLTRILELTRTVDFAVLIATPDDALTKRGAEYLAPRDNVILELGMFMSALGPERAVLLLAANKKGSVELPSDLNGLTYMVMRTRDDGDIGAAADDVALEIEQAVERLGARSSMPANSHPTGVDQAALLQEELARLRMNVEQQGWRVQKEDTTVFRIKDRPGRPFTYQLNRDPMKSREGLRPFVRTLRSNGLRVNYSVRATLEQMA